MVKRRLIAGATILALLLATGYATLAFSVPDVRGLAHRHPTGTAFMRARPGPPNARARALAGWWVPLDSMSPLAVCAVVKAEDGAFFEHGGIDWTETRAALRGALRGQPLTGASTITQQLARNLYLGPERTAVRKLREAFIARELERRLTKERILELYLNVVEQGEGIWGIGQASDAYFGESPGRIGAFEAAFLASLLPAPRRPLAGANLLRARRVQGRVLHQLYLSGMLGDGEWRTAMGRRRAFTELRMRGDPLLTALGKARSAAAIPIPTPVRPVPTPLPLSRAVGVHCGRAQELRNIRLLRAAVNP